MRPSIGLPVLLWLLCGNFAAQAADTLYAVDPGASDFHWLVYKAGAFARLGHNHVIKAAALDGNVTVDGSNPANSRFEIMIPVADLTVDDPALRSGLGEEFASVPTPDDIAGTRKNMLSDRVLDGVKFPMIRITGTGPIDGQGAQTLKVRVELLGRSVDLTVPTEVSVEAERVEASGEFELSHADLGMQPFTVMMGALQVGEKLSFSYRIVARLVP